MTSLQRLLSDAACDSSGFPDDQIAAGVARRTHHRRNLRIAVAATVITLLIAVPIALISARGGDRTASIASPPDTKLTTPSTPVSPTIPPELLHDLALDQPIRRCTSQDLQFVALDPPPGIQVFYYRFRSAASDPCALASWPAVQVRTAANEWRALPTVRGITEAISSFPWTGVLSPGGLDVVMRLRSIPPSAYADGRCPDRTSEAGATYSAIRFNIEDTYLEVAEPFSWSGCFVEETRMGFVSTDPAHG